MIEPVARRGADSISSSPAGFPALGPGPCKPRRRHSRRQVSSKKAGVAVPVTAAAVATASKTAAAAVGVASEWVWGQGSAKVPAVEVGSAQGAAVEKPQQHLLQGEQEKREQQSRRDVADDKKPSEMQKMFAGSSSSSFESTCR